jgi:TP901 family phage tail tape measure protein
MATKSIDIVLSAKDRASGAINRSAGIISRSLGGIGRVGRGAMGLLGMGTGLGFGFQLSMGIRRFASDSVRAGVDFEKAMSRIKAVTPGATDRMEELSNAAQEQGLMWGRSSVDAADGMFELSKAGLDVDAIMGTIPHTMALAAAGELDVAEAASLSVAAMKNLGMGVGEMGRVSDVIVRGANDSLASVHGLGESFKFVGALGANLGKDLEDVVGPLMVLNDVGLSPDMAGTGLRQVFTDLAGGNAMVNSFLQSLGMNTAALREMELADQIEAVSAAMSHLGDKERAALVMEKFGERSGAAMLALMNQGPEAIRAADASVRAAAGTTQQVAADMLDNVSGSFAKLRQSIAILKEDLFGSKSGLLKSMLDGMTGFVRFLGTDGLFGTIFDEIAMQLMGFATVQLPKWFFQLSEIVAFHAVDIGTRMAFGIAEGLLGLERLMVDTVLGAVETTWGKLGDIVGTVAPDHVNFPKQIAEAAKSAANVADTVGGALGSKLEATKKTALAANKAIHDERMAEISAEYDADLQYIADSSTARWSALFAEADKSKQAKDDSIPLAANLGAGAENIEAATAGMNEAAQESKALMAIGDSSLPSLNESRFLTGLGSRHKEDLDEAKRHTALLKAILSALGGLPASGGGPGLGIL